MADERFPDAFARELSDVSVELERVSDLADGVARSLTNAFRGAIVDGQSLRGVLAEVSRAFADIALKAAPETSDLLIDRAVALAALNEYAAARRDLDVALRVDPTREDVLALRAAARRQTGDMAGAMEDAETALAIQPRLPEALLERGILRLNRGDKQGARRDLVEVRLVAPDSPAAVSAGQYIEQMDVKQD